MAHTALGADASTEDKGYTSGFSPSELTADVGLLSMLPRDGHLAVDNDTSVVRSLENFTKQAPWKTASPLIREPPKL